MNPLRFLCLLACLVAGVLASSNSLNNRFKPAEWMSAAELNSLPSVDQLNYEQLENMSADEAARLVNKIYNLAMIDYSIAPSYVPNPNDVPVYLYRPNEQRVKTNLNQFVEQAKQQPKFGTDEVTVYITGLPSTLPSVKKANQKLVQAYMQRYNENWSQYQQDQQQQQQQQQGNQDNDYPNDPRTSSEENENSPNNNQDPDQGHGQGQGQSQNQNQNQGQGQGQVVVIDLGDSMQSFKQLARLNVPKTGEMVGKALVQLTDNTRLPYEMIHLIGQGVGAHVAGAAGRTYTRHTGHKLHRITGLDPSKIYAQNPETLSSMARGDADFVDAIHTSAYGMGTPQRSGDVDFYPNGPSVTMPGADNIIEAAMRATRYYAESARPGHERDFPAVKANSMQQYKNNNGHGQRAYMGVDAEHDLEGDYVLQVNAKSPFGKSTPAQKQNTYHGTHQPWNKNSNDNSNGNNNNNNYSQNDY